MPHATLKLKPGVDQNRTPTLNEAAISDTQLVRFVPDKEGISLVQKLGGWTRFYINTFYSTIRALWAWEDTNATSHLGVGTESFTKTTTGASGTGSVATITFSGTDVIPVGTQVTISGVTPSGYNGSVIISASSAGSISFPSSTTAAQTVAGKITSESLYVITDNNISTITPRSEVFSVAVSASATAGDPQILITCAASNVLNGDNVWIKGQISIAGLILFGVYSVTRFTNNSFYITATNVLGTPTAANATTTSASTASFTFTSGSAFVSVQLNNHGFSVGSTFTVLLPTVLGDVTVYGNYIVTALGQVGSGANPTNYFQITLDNTPTSSGTASLNGGLAYYEFFKTPGPTPPGSGYGAYGYGEGGYGIGVPGSGSASYSGIPLSASDWTLDNWGEVFIACTIYDQNISATTGPIFSWTPTSGSTIASYISNSPPVNDGCFVAMPQRQIVAWGSTFTGIQDPLLIRWCDVNNYNSWVATVTNQAGSYRLPKGSRIICAIQGPQQGLVWTDLGIWAMQYVGPPYVYQFNELGTGCGLIARKAAAAMNGVIYWMGQSQFYRLSGTGVEIIRCPIWDVIFQDLDTTNLNKIRIAPNSRFGEVSWYYPTQSNGGEVSHYVKYNVVLDQWDYGVLGRTAWINESVLGPPIGSGTSPNYIYQHETSKNADGQAIAASFQTGYFSISEGEFKVFVDQVWPDMKWGYYGGNQDADLSITFYVTDYPGDTPRTYGPYPFNQTTQYITPRFRGRLMAIKIESSDLDSFWRIGAMRYRFEPDGKFQEAAIATLDDILTAQKNGVVAINNLNQTWNNYLIQTNGQYSSTEITSATLLYSGIGTLVKVSVIQAGSTTGFIYDFNSAAVAVTGRRILAVPNTLGLINAGLAFTLGLVVVPGAGQSIVVSYSQE